MLCRSCAALKRLLIKVVRNDSLITKIPFILEMDWHLQNTERLNHSVAINTNKQNKEHFSAISHIPETYLTAQVACHFLLLQQPNKWSIIFVYVGNWELRNWQLLKTVTRGLLAKGCAWPSLTNTTNQNIFNSLITEMKVVWFHTQNFANNGENLDSSEKVQILFLVRWNWLEDLLQNVNKNLFCK